MSISEVKVLKFVTLKLRHSTVAEIDEFIWSSRGRCGPPRWADDKHWSWTDQQMDNKCVTVCAGKLHLFSSFITSSTDKREFNLSLCPTTHFNLVEGLLLQNCPSQELTDNNGAQTIEVTIFIIFIMFVSLYRTTKKLKSIKLLLSWKQQNRKWISRRKHSHIYSTSCWASDTVRNMVMWHSSMTVHLNDEFDFSSK